MFKTNLNTLKNLRNVSNNQQGQTLVAIVFLMLISLGIGLAISNRFLNSLRSYTIADNASKALAVAEASIERVLVTPNEDLENYINFGNCGELCSLQINDPSGTVVSANVNLSYAGNSDDPYPLNLEQGRSSQVTLTGYPTSNTLDVCWNTQSSIHAIYIYEDGSEVKADSYAYNSLSSPISGNGFSSASARHGYNSCFAVSTTSTPRMLRLKPYYFDTQIVVIPSPGQIIPKQGILIEAEGRAGDEVKRVSAQKTGSLSPTFFDYVLYQKSPTEALSNIVD